MSDFSITIITVCFNSEKTIGQTIESVLAQTFSDYQYIIVDGKSTDSTMDIVNSYQEKFEKGRFKVVSEPDRGIYDAMNKGIRLAEGELIGIINSDDWYEKDALETAWHLYQDSREKNVIIYGAMRYLQEERLDRIIYFRHEFIAERMICHPTCFVAKKVYDQIGLFDENYRIAADHDFIWRAVEREIFFIGVDKIMANFRMGGISGVGDAEDEVLQIRYQHGYFNKREYQWKSMKHRLKHGMFQAEKKLRIVRR